MILKKLINKYSSVHRETKATFWYTICNILQKGVSFITLPIFTRLLTVSDIGVCNLYNSWAAIFSVFVTLYLPYGVFSVAMQKYKNDRTVYISSMQIILLCWGCFVLLLTLIFNETLELFLFIRRTPYRIDLILKFKEKILKVFQANLAFFIL